MQNILSAKKISKSFDGTKVLNEIDLTINESEIISISGPSGAGKTTQGKGKGKGKGKGDQL